MPSPRFDSDDSSEFFIPDSTTPGQSVLSRRALLRAGVFGIGAIGVGQILAACTTASEQPASEETPADATQAEGTPVAGGTFVLSIDTTAGTVEPGRFSSFGDWMAVDCIARGLVHNDYQADEFQGAMAESWDVSDDGRVYTFKLRQGVTFHDGTTLTAEDCVKSWDRQIVEDHPAAPDSPNPTLRSIFAGNVLSYEAIDDETFVVTLDRPEATFLASITQPAAVILSGTAIDDQGADLSSNLVGAGPFRFVSATSGQEIELEAFEDYYGGRPNVDRVVMRPSADPSALVASIVSGEVSASSFLPHSNADQLEGNEAARVYDASPLVVTYLGMNVTAETLQDLRVRQAINLAIDREAVVNQVFFGRAETPAYMIAPPEIGYDPALKRLTTQDVDRARELIEESGAVGRKIRFMAQNISFYPALGQIVERNLQDIGLDVEAEYVDAGTFYGVIFNPEENELFVNEQSSYMGDPDDKIGRLFGTGTTFASIGMAIEDLPSQPRVDELIARSREETDPDVRLDVYNELQTFLAEEVMAMAPLAHFANLVASHASVEDLNANALGTQRVFLEGASFAQGN